MSSQRIVLVNVGPRGDVVPYCVLGQALAARGYDVAIATEKRLQDLVTVEFGLSFHCIAGDVCGGLFDRALQKRFRVARALKCIEMLDEWNVRHLDEQAMLASYIAALGGADIIVSGAQSMAQSYSVAERNEATWIPLFLGNCPLPTSAFPHWIAASIPFGFLCPNKWTHSVVASKTWQHQRQAVNAWRVQVLGLSPIHTPLGVLDLVNANNSIAMYQATSTLLCGPSKHVPSDYLKGKVVYGGFLHHTDSPPNQTTLQVHLAPSLSIHLKPCLLALPQACNTSRHLDLLWHHGPLRQLVQFADQVAKLAKVQCVLFVLEAKSNLSALAAKYAERLHIEQSQPPTWLLSRMSCNVHHASLNSTAMALAIGVPQIPCPMMMDQFHHANELLALGVAPAVVYKGSLDALTVARHVQRVLDNTSDIQAKARDIGAFVATESKGAIDLFCRSIGSTPRTFAV
ncbi:hypothetical protein AeNC1_007195 [Aphanomyces euteiches]|nr:hypothetical protein AeNC1_007195 [Aphanomyces euteiches]